MKTWLGVVYLWVTISCMVHAAEDSRIGLTTKMWKDSLAAVEAYKKESHLIAGESGMYLYFLSSDADGTKMKVGNFWYASNIGADFKATFGDANQKMTSSITVEKAGAEDHQVKVSCKITRQEQGAVHDVNFFAVKVQPMSKPQVIGGVPDGKSGRIFIVVEYFDKR